MQKPLKPISGAIPAAIHRRLLALAREERRSVSQLVRIAIEEFVQRRRAA